MFEKPTLFHRKGYFEIYVPVHLAGKLRTDLAMGGFDVTQLEVEFGFEDLDAGVKTDLAILELPKETERRALIKYLHNWKE